MIFNTLVVISIVAIHWYLWKRLVQDTTHQGLPRRIGTAIVIALGISMPMTLFGVRDGYFPWLYWPGYIWVAVMFYLLVTLSILEIPRWIRRRKTLTRTPQTTPEKPNEDRRLLLARGTAIFAGLTAASITGYGVKTAAGPPRINRFHMPMTKLPRRMDGIRLAVVSDIHIGPTTGAEHARRVTQVINSVNADIVCVVGDLVDGTVAQIGPFVAPLAGIQSKKGTYFVTGNHEYYTDYTEWIDEVAEFGMRPLRNERVELDGLDLAGVNDLDGEMYGDPADFALALGNRDMTRPVVLMAHQPVAAEKAAPYGVDLQVSGHTHGGQMVPFNLLVRLSQPVVSGFGNVDGVPIFVTNGAGSWGPPVRVGAPPQVTVIELRSA
ncbi:metallophosphoesterase [Actinoplanes sp. CA-015351]|uniref:metallophosphoesterase n=1 Tax=Actinoplanes sp. CA-015351 TaxID=3239897 RepID=UPI003D965FB9